MVKSIPYEVVRHLGEAELRRYDELVLATVYDMEEDESFQLLFRYIGGENDGQVKLSMTTPVVTRTGEPADPDSEGHMSFILPSEVKVSQAPKPSDPRVVLETKKGGIFAIMRFRGKAVGDDVQRMTNELLGELKEANYVMDGRPFLLRYNSPFTPGFLRHNEVAVRVAQK
ncbi:MAG: heme-binding protein [Methanomassiliicoccales archaeon]|nr:heme-binding protein [Methanomassiliicoccales archaeon]